MCCTSNTEIARIERLMDPGRRYPRPCAGEEGFSVAVFTLIGEGQRIQFLFPNRNRSGGSWLCHLRRAGDRKSLDLMLQQNGEEGAALFGSLLQRPNPKG
ncbi:hypothetical protein MRB53_029991 [Persea americana]|uniref:Uncharacterized protein n=1 Tax=Persea americana TaxID=3435 RepID=A0ACC2KK28_PERAE|nr:hypothetical protein MRB53_029991 [Persea americana]